MSESVNDPNDKGFEWQLCVRHYVLYLICITLFAPQDNSMNQFFKNSRISYIFKILWQIDWEVVVFG